MGSPTSLCWRTNSHSRSSSVPGLARIASGTRGLADVVQLGGAADVVELLGLEAEPDADAQSEVGDVAHVIAQVGLTLVQDLQQRVAGLFRDRVAAALELLGVQALV